MRALANISVLFLLILGSCSSTQYSGSEYDDLYYSSSDKPASKSQPSVNDKVAEQNLSVNDYYDNMYAVDTLVSDQFNEAVRYDDQIIINNNYGGGYDYYNNSYSGRLNMFYGNYFNPYWQDPFYFNAGYGYPYSGFGLGFGYPYFRFGFNYGFPYYPFYNTWYGYGSYYPYYYGGYNPYYYCCGYNTGYIYDDYYVDYGRRERASTMSSRTGNSSISAGGGYSRRDASLTSRAGSSGESRTYAGTESVSTSSRRTDPSTGTGVSKSAVPGRTSSQEAAKGASARSNSSLQEGSSGTRPEYKNSNRTYTPSYNNPRMSTRPSYNNSRSSVSEPDSRMNNASYSRTPSGSSSVQNSNNTIKSVPSTGGGQRSPAYRPGNPGQYSVPVRRSSDGVGNTSSGSYSRSSSGYSSPSRSSGSSVSSGSGSRSSYSSGSSSYSSGSSSNSSGSSSGSSSHGSSGSSSGRR